MADATQKVNGISPSDAQPGIGHNRPSLAEAAEANVRSGVLLLCKEALITAIQDRRLHRDHLRVLAAIAMFVNTQTAKAWPSRAAISSMSGLTVRGVSNALLQLRNWGYLIADRETVEEAGSKRLTVYTFGNIDHEEIRRQITAICHELQRKRNADEKSPPEVTSEKSLPGVTVTSEGDFQHEKVTPEGDNKPEKSPPAVRSIYKKNNIPLTSSKTPPKGKPRTKLSESWTPAAPTIAWAKTNFVVTDQQIADEAEKFHNYHFGKGSRMADWHAAWRTWWLNGYHGHKRRRNVPVSGASLPFGNASIDERKAADEMAAAYERIMAEEEAGQCQR